MCNKQGVRLSLQQLAKKSSVAYQKPMESCTSFMLPMFGLFISVKKKKKRVIIFTLISG